MLNDKSNETFEFFDFKNPPSSILGPVAVFLFPCCHSHSPAPPHPDSVVMLSHGKHLPGA